VEPVIGDDYFTGDVVVTQRGQGFIDADGEGFRLVQARHDDRHLNGDWFCMD